VNLAKRSEHGYFQKIKLGKRSELVYFKNWQYRSEANRFDNDFVFKKTKKSELSFFLKTKGKKRKGSIVNYRSFAIPTHLTLEQSTSRRGRWERVWYRQPAAPASSPLLGRPDPPCTAGLKGTVPRGFRLLVFFMNQFPPRTLVYQ
jgi:hypothetical protein